MLKIKLYYFYKMFSKKTNNFVKINCFYCKVDLLITL